MPSSGAVPETSRWTCADRAIVSILVTTAARNSSVRLLRVDDIDFERAVIRFRRAKGGKTLDVALQPMPGGPRRLPGSWPTGPGDQGRPWRARTASCSPPRQVRNGAAGRQCPLAHADPPLPRRRREPAVLRLTPDPPCDGDASGQQRDASRRGLPVSGPLLHGADPTLCPADSRSSRRAGGQCSRASRARGGFTVAAHVVLPCAAPDRRRTGRHDDTIVAGSI